MRATLKRPANEAGPKTLRIAAYTRKSVDDPTDQTFTSVWGIGFDHPLDV